MALHHKIKPHHHISIWVISAVTLGTMALISYNAPDSSANSNGPSAKTKKFFGADDDKVKERMYNPTECQQDQGGQEQQARAYDLEMRQLQGEMQQLQGQIQQAATPEEQATLQQQMQTKQTRMQEIQAAMQNMQQKQQQGPSLACKQALIKVMKAEMAEMKSMINTNILGTFGKVNAAIAKIEAKIPALKDSGVDAAVIARIEKDIASIKANEATLKTFFNNMLAVMTKFLNLADSDIDQAFSTMKNGMGGGAESDKAAKAADGLVAAFEDLEAAVNLIK